MADDASVLAKCEDAYNEARALPGNGLPPIGDQIADLNSQVSSLTTQLATANAATQAAVDAKNALQAKVDAVKAARTAEEAGEHSADDARAAIDAALA